MTASPRVSELDPDSRPRRLRSQTPRRDNSEIGQREHWQQVFTERDTHAVSWYEDVPEASLALIERAAVGPNAPILDAGGGASKLAGLLADAGYVDVTVADISAAALARARAELGEGAGRITWVEADLRSHDFGRSFELWHDRALFHFMVDDADREGYLAVLRRSLCPGGYLVLAAFGPRGPTECSALPVVRYGAEDLGAALGAGFTLISAQTLHHRTPSGKVQEFTYSHFRRLPSA